MNKYKGGMTPDELYRHMYYLCDNYNPDGADASYKSNVEGEDVEVTKASRLYAQRTFPKNLLMQ